MSETRGRWSTGLAPVVRPAPQVQRRRSIVRPRSSTGWSDGLAAEREGEWDELPFEPAAGPPVDADPDGPVAAAVDVDVDPALDPLNLLAQLSTLTDELVGLRVDQLSDLDLDQVLRCLQPTVGRLQALRTRAAGEYEARAVDRAGPGREQRGEQDARKFLRHELGLTPGEAKQAGTTGRRLRETPELGAAHATGRISEPHAQTIAELLSWLPEAMSTSRRETFEADLIALAGELEIVSFGKKARRMLAEIDLRAAEDREHRQHRRRSLTIGTAEDGAVVGSFRLYGLQAEKLRTALDAASLPDPAEGPFRSTEQRNADGLEVLCDLALRSGDLPTQHGVRPHVSVLVPWSELALGAGIAELGFTGPITIASLRPLLRDCTVSRIILGPDSVPVEVGEASRTILAGFWRMLVARDRGCTWDGCEAIAAWCQVAHGQVPFREGGRLRLGDAALLCVRHHRIFDSQPWTMIIRGPDVSYERADEPVRSGSG